MKTMIKKVAGLFGLSLLLLASATINAQSIQVSLPDTTGNPGQVLEIPLRITALETSDAVTSGEFTLNFNGNIIQVQSVKTAGTLLDGNTNVWYNSTSRKLAFAGSTPVTGSGALVILNVLVQPTASKSSQTSLQISSSILNEGNPAVTAQNGSVRVKGININPSFLNFAVVGDSIQFSASGDVMSPLIWEITNTSAGSITSTGKFAGHTPGFTRVRVTDAQGLRDSTNLFRVQPTTFTTLQVSTPDTSYQQTRIVKVPVKTTTLDDLNVKSLQGRVRFNSSHLQYVGVETTGTLLHGAAAPTVFHQNDRITVAAASTVAIEGSGVLFYVLLRVSQSYSGSSTIFIENFKFNEDIEPNTKNGQINITAAPVITVSPGSLQITRGKTRQFTVSGEGQAPFTWTSTDSSVASIDSDGLLTAHTRGTVIIRAIDSDNFPSQSASVTVNDIDVWIPNVDLNFPAPVSVPIIVESLDGLGILSFEASVKYDSTVVVYDGFSLTSSIASGSFIDINFDGNDVQIAGASSSIYSGDGALLYLNFIPAPGVNDQDATMLELTRMIFNESSPSTPTATKFNGSVTIDVPFAVWPGDTNFDGVVDIFDVLPLGEYFGESGPPRSDQTISWNFKSATPWDVVEATHADANGNGMVDQNDLLPIGVNFGKSKAVAEKNLPGDVDFISAISLKPGVAGTKLNLGINFGNPTGDTESILGFALVIDADPDLIKFNVYDIAQWYYVPDLISMVRHDKNTNEYSIAYSRKSASHGAVLGKGIIMQLEAEYLQDIDSDSELLLKAASVTPGADDSGRLSLILMETTSADTPNIPDQFLLSQNYPNPFNPTTSISFTLPVSEKITLKVYDITGRMVAELANNVYAAGEYTVVFDAKNLSSGVYIYKLETSAGIKSAKMVLLK